MGVLEFFGTLIRNNITSSAIQSDFTDNFCVDHIFFDFNSFLYGASAKIIKNINMLMSSVLSNLYNNRPNYNRSVFNKFSEYNVDAILDNIINSDSPNEIITIFHNHFNNKFLAQLILISVTDTFLNILQTYCQNKQIKTIMIALDGVPSKAKMIEQRQRRHMGAITEKYKKKILKEYKKYLLKQPDYIYLTTRHDITWSTNNFTPGTQFMDKLIAHLNSDQFKDTINQIHPHAKIIISDVYEIGEGEKKIMNYIKKYLSDTSDTIMVYSPDADVILLCMLLQPKKIYYLRHNQQASAQTGSDREVYDLIDVFKLKNNISHYINNHKLILQTKFNIDANKIANDIVFISTLFGNDFVPKSETINVKRDFYNVLESYIITFASLNGNYLLTKRGNSDYRINIIFFNNFIYSLLHYESNFIVHNDLYSQYINAGQFNYVFDYVQINAKNIGPIFREFTNNYNALKNTIKTNGNIHNFLSHDTFLTSLKKCIIIEKDKEIINVSELDNNALIRLLKEYYKKENNFPRLSINLNQKSYSINDYRHRKATEGFNEYKKEIYKFDNMLDDYYIKFNAQPLNLSDNEINAFYVKYFDTPIYKNYETYELTNKAKKIMDDYLKGILWVLDYYYNDKTYLNTWFYPHEKAPLLGHFHLYINTLTQEKLNIIHDNLKQFRVHKIKDFFNPIEQLIYVSPMTQNVLKMLPRSYRQYFTSNEIDPYLKAFFININVIVNRMWKDKISHDIDCHSIPYLNKCLIFSIPKLSTQNDISFLNAIRNISSISIPQNRIPDF